MPVPSIEIQQLARAFFAEAQRDLGDAKVLQNAKRKAAAMTSCQHAVEKALKTIYILAQSKRPPMTHTMLNEIDKYSQTSRKTYCANGSRAGLFILSR